MNMTAESLMADVEARKSGKSLSERTSALFGVKGDAALHSVAILLCGFSVGTLLAAHQRTASEVHVAQVQVEGIRADKTTEILEQIAHNIQKHDGEALASETLLSGRSQVHLPKSGASLASNHSRQ